MTSTPHGDAAPDIDVDRAGADSSPADEPTAPEPLLTTDADAQTDDPLIDPESS